MPPPPSPWQLIGQLSTVGLSFVLALVIGFGGGYWLDARLGTKPWLSFLGFFFGLAAGVLNVYRIMQVAGQPPAPGDLRPRDSGAQGVKPEATAESHVANGGDQAPRAESPPDLERP